MQSIIHLLLIISGTFAISDSRNFHNVKSDLNAEQNDFIDNGHFNKYSHSSHSKEESVFPYGYRYNGPSHTYLPPTQNRNKKEGVYTKKQDESSETNGIDYQLSKQTAAELIDFSNNNERFKLSDAQNFFSGEDNFRRQSVPITIEHFPQKKMFAQKEYIKHYNDKAGRDDSQYAQNSANFEKMPFSFSKYPGFDSEHRFSEFREDPQFFGYLYRKDNPEILQYSENKNLNKNSKSVFQYHSFNRQNTHNLHNNINEPQLVFYSIKFNDTQQIPGYGNPLTESSNTLNLFDSGVNSLFDSSGRTKPPPKNYQTYNEGSSDYIQMKSNSFQLPSYSNSFSVSKGNTETIPSLTSFNNQNNAIDSHKNKGKFPTRAEKYVESPSHINSPIATLNNQQQFSYGSYQKISPESYSPPSQILLNLEAPRQLHAFYGYPLGFSETNTKKIMKSTNANLPSQEFLPPYY